MSRTNFSRALSIISRHAARWTLLASFFLCNALPLLGQEYPNRIYTMEDGLPSSRIRDITQDARGQLWVATQAGVATWGGRDWTTYNVAHGLNRAEQFGLRWDDEGRLWSVSREAPFRISRFDGAAWAESTIFDGELPNDVRLTAFEVQRLGEGFVLALGTAENGLLLYRAGRWQRLGEQEGVPDRRIRALAGNEDRVVIATLGGLAELTSSGQINRIDSDLMPTPGVTGLAWEEDERQLWVLGERWIGRLVEGAFTLLVEDLRIPEPSSRKKAVGDGQGGLYFGNRRAVFYFHPALGVERLGPENGLLADGARALFFDREDNLWVGEPRGLVKITTRRFGKYTRRQGLLEDEVTAVVERGDGEIVLAHPRGLSRLRGNRVETLRLKGEGGSEEVQRVQDLAEDPQGNLWLAARGTGLARVSPKGQVRWFGATEGLPGAVTSVRVDAAGRLWASTNEALFLQRGEKFHRATPQTLKFDVRRIFEGSAGQIRLATMEGLFQLSFEDVTSEGELVDPQWRNWTCEESKPCNSVFAVLERPGGGVWAGTSVGLFRTEGERLVAETSPQVQNPIYFILRDRAGRVWFGIDNGVKRWDGRNLEAFTVREGVAGRETNRAAGMMDSQGHLWFGTEQGVTFYDERLPEPIREPPFLELVAVEVSGRRLPPNEPLTLDFSDNDLAFHYRVISLMDETRIRIGYQLEGVEDRRVAFAGPMQVVRYPNLDPGEYRFRIAAGSSEDRWTAEEVSASIVIQQPISQRPWFYGVLAGLLALAVYFIQSFFAQRRYSRQLEGEVAQRLDELHASEERYRRIFERNRAAMLILDGDDLAIADANRAACVFYGYRQEEIKTLTHEDLLVVEEVDSLERLSMESRTHLMVERHRLKSGEVRDVETYASAILVEGRPTLFVIVHDVTERRLVEESMLTEKERLAITLRHIDDGVITMDHQGKILLLNRKAEEIVEQASSEVVGRPLGGVLRLHEMAIGGTLGRRVSLPWEETEGVPVGTFFESISEAILLLPEKKQRLLELSGSPIKQLSGEVSGWVLAFHDITEKRKIEEELVRAQKMEALGILAGGIAHDFNNLLTVLLGNLSLLADGAELGPRERSNLENAETAVMRARDLAQQLLTFSSGGAPVRKAASMREVIQESASFVLRGSAVRAEVEMAEDLWVVEIDPGQINQVLNNLLINAMQSMPAGGTVRIRGENLEKPPGILPPVRHIAIHISDEGAGIDKDHLDRIFDPYFTTKEGGRGLGLTSAYSIVKQHDGLLTVRSEAGVGTTFSIHLPATSADPEQAPKPQAIFSQGTGKILVMDDDDGVRLVLESIVERLGYRPVATVDGKEAIAHYRASLEGEEPFAAVIMDLTIPGGMGGQEALEHLQQIDPDVRAIVVSGYSNNPVLANYRDFGFKGRVSKPFKVEELRSVLAQVLEEGGGGAVEEGAETAGGEAR